VVLGLVSAGAAVYMMVKDSFSPHNAEKVASQLVTLPNPLPDGWVWGVGLDVGYQRTANLQNRRTGKGHALIQFSQIKIKGNQRAKVMAEKFVMPSVSGMRFELDSKGEETIAGKTAYFVRQHGSVMGKKSAMEIALVDFPGGGILQIQSSEDGLEEFDPDIVAPILNAITSIGPSENPAR
jgi:hypothetical protein